MTELIGHSSRPLCIDTLQKSQQQSTRTMPTNGWRCRVKPSNLRQSLHTVANVNLYNLGPLKNIKNHPLQTEPHSLRYFSLGSPWKAFFWGKFIPSEPSNSPTPRNSCCFSCNKNLAMACGLQLSISIGQKSRTYCSWFRNLANHLGWC